MKLTKPEFPESEFPEPEFPEPEFPEPAFPQTRANIFSACSFSSAEGGSLFIYVEYNSHLSLMFLDKFDPNKSTLFSF